jgi:hypothetical protein
MRIAVAVLGLSLAAIPATVAAQAAKAPSRSADSAAVLRVAESVFDAMRKRDTVMLKAAFAPDARLTTAAAARDGSPRIMSEKLESFVTALSQPSDSVWDEKTFEHEVRIDGNLATAWMEYDFYLGTRFSHCGVDAFQLARFAEGWKIVALADTRQREGCPRTPPAPGN